MSPRYRSWSQLNQYEKCGWEYKLKRIDCIPETPSVWLAGGNAYHTACEQFDLAACEMGLDGALIADWAALFLAELEIELGRMRKTEPDETKWRTAKSQLVKYKATGETVEYWQEHGPKMVDKYVQWRLANRELYDIFRLPNGEPLLELEVRVLTGGAPIIAKADAVFVDLNTGATIVVDRKSGKNVPDSMDQLLLYAKTLMQAGVAPIWYGAYFMARPGKLLEPKPMSLDSTFMEARFAKMDRDERAGIYEAKVTNLCNWCGVSKHCDAFKESNV